MKLANLKIYIRTFGCQMNEYDANAIYQHLRQKGCAFSDSINNADIVIIETCSVRQKAEDKVLGLLGMLCKRKRAKGLPFIVVGGCMAERMKEDLSLRFPEISLIVGPGHVDNIADKILKIIESDENKTLIETGFEDNAPFLYKKGMYEEYSSVKAFVTAVRGCTNFCSYCIVPFVRGPEKSRNSDEILTEINELTQNGVKEITLLGQNINIYGKDLLPAMSFTELLKEILLEQFCAILQIFLFLHFYNSKNLLERVANLLDIHPSISRTLGVFF